ncbi:MAG TPA: cobalt ECF transporter T component CbiQ [Anaerolineaceae bacterium]|nr:cobalt ECF transporter T component CbiQ [Anaerolineaceae bacterium]
MDGAQSKIHLVLTMHVHFLDPYHERTGPLHRLDARIKLLLVLGFILTSALLASGAWPAYLLLLGLLVSAEILSDLKPGFFLKRSLLAIPFVLAAAPLLVWAGPPYLAKWTLGGLPLRVSAAGLERFLSIGFKSWLSLQAAVLLTATTPFPDLLLALRAIRVPRVLVAVVGLMWRYLFVLIDEVFRMARARAARSGAGETLHGRAGGSLRWRAGVTGGMAGGLFLRSYDRGERTYLAMLSRGYDGEVRSLPPPPLGRSDVLALCAAGGLYVCILILGWAFGRG